MNGISTFPNQFLSKSREFANLILVEGIEPVVMEENQFDNRDSSISKAFWRSETIKTQTQGAEPTFSKTSGPPKAESFKLRPSSEKSSQWLLRTMSWNIESQN